MSNYHDQNYDGLVIKIPSAIIRINEDKANPLLKELEHFLENALSKYHPDMIKSVFEIQNYQEKTKIAQEEREDAKKIRLKRIEYNQKLLNLDIIEMIEKLGHDDSDIEYLYIPLKDGTSVSFKWDELFTNKSNPKKDTLTKLLELSTQIDLIEFALKNQFYHLQQFSSHMPKDFPWWKFIRIKGYTLGYNSTFRIKYDMWKVKFQKGNLNDMRYTERELTFNLNNEMLIPAHYTDETPILLTDYERCGYKFIKK